MQNDTKDFQKENTNYWIINLRTSTLFLLRKKQKRENIGAVTYVGISKPAAFLLKLHGKLNFFSFPFHKVKERSGPAGPILHLCDVKNDKGEVFCQEIYHHILDVRRQIWDRFLENHKSFRFIKQEKTLSGLAAYLGLIIAEEIKTAVYLSHFARWKNHQPGSDKQIKNIIVKPRCPWDQELIPHLEKNVDGVILQKEPGQGLRMRLHRIKRYLVAVKTTGFTHAREYLNAAPGAEPSPLNHEYKKEKFMVLYGMGVLKEQRNDIPFLHAAGIDPSRLVVYYKFDHLKPSAAENEWIKTNNASCFVAPGEHALAEAANAPVWTPSPLFQKEMASFYKLFLYTIGQCKQEKKHKKETQTGYAKTKQWLLDQLWVMGQHITYWKDFFVSNNIGIVVNQIPSSHNFIPNLAMEQINGLVVEFERSIRFDYCTYIHNSFNHAAFITGPYSLTQIPEESFSLSTLQCGGINTESGRDTIEGLDKLRENRKIIIAVFDEIPNDVFFGESIRVFYESLIQLVREDRRFGLLIKTKKPVILERFDGVRKDIEQLQAQGSCLVAGWQEKVSTAAANSDVVATMPSTAAFESAMIGLRTIIFNPMKSGSKLFYTNNGLNRRIFEDGPNMIEALKKYADGDDSVGNCTDLAPQIDPFADAGGAKRIGEYIQWCLDGFHQNIQPDALLNSVNKRFAETYGNDRITSQNAYENVL